MFVTLPLRATEWQEQLQCTPAGKAVPADSAPATAWKACSHALAPSLAKAADALQHVNTTLPFAWKDPQLCFIPKPHKPPISASALRPIGLLRPDSKALAGHIRNLILEQAGPSLAQSPQFAYLPFRDTTDALARVNARIRKIKANMKALGGNRFVVRQRKETGSRRVPALSRSQSSF